MTSSAPRLVCHFARAAKVAVIVRRGPSRYSQMILWRTDNDEFELGQWIRGHVKEFTMTSDAKYAAVKVMATRTRIKSWEDTQQAIVCRPPYFTALEVYLGGLCSTHAYIDRHDRLFTLGGRKVVNATGRCPLERTEKWPVDLGYPNQIDSSSGPAKGRDQGDRKIQVSDGKIFAVEDGEQRLLFDASLNSFEAVEALEWAKEW